MAIFEVSYKNNHKVIKILGLKLKFGNYLYKKYKKIHERFKKNKNFDCLKFDNEIAQVTEKT